MPKFTVLTHGGAGSDPDDRDGTHAAAERGLDVLREGGTVLDAVCAAVVVLEDDPRFNAGTGSSLRIDGRTVEMDASVMDDTGLFGAVAVLRDVRNPVLVAREVARTQHILLAGEGANAFARERGFPRHDPTTRRAQETFARVRASATDTVGAVASDGTRFAAALSTGGPTLALLGRVGDVPLPGCGLFAGPAGAVAATGRGEEIARRVLARGVYAAMAAGAPVQRAAEEAVALFRPEIDVGIIAVGKEAHGIASNRSMAWSALVR